MIWQAFYIIYYPCTSLAGLNLFTTDLNFYNQPRNEMVYLESLLNYYIFCRIRLPNDDYISSVVQKGGGFESAMGFASQMVV